MSDAAPSGRELEILKVLWDLGPSTVRQVHQRMCPGGELAFNTVQTLLRIMDDKGLVSHRARGRTFVYTPRHDRDRETSRLLHQVFDGAIDQFVVSLLKSADAGPAELKKIEQIITSARRRKQEGQPRRT
ncbi:MAG TPA: BlaI/MecI/CopY family transcriptional regulator [Pirellulales bacterium]|jgi:predicted transcriptional regulator|nr:BlaI/MecI/CopY family transcriptional regulator [Pirellulales bacterium]HEV3021846.1 BlaI/MecI/CopY family transcriptional regulator [Pirellulales bacterium]